jgi:DNA-binding transcriptional MerR regulator
MSSQPARGYLGISEVLAQLRGEFPDISVSKIRFLETEGLIAPARSPSGYRRFGAADIDRLRYILSAQRDQYLPLRVIKERLARLEPGGDSAADWRRTAAPRPDGADRHPRRPGADAGPAGAGPADAAGNRLLTRSELVAAAGLTEALLTELETFGLLRRVGRHYGPDALQVSRAAAALTVYGVEARHLRAVRAAAERETTMIESLVAPILRQRSRGARDLAVRTAGELAAHVLRLHGALVDAALAEAGLGGSAAESPSTAGDPQARAVERGVAGASA